MKVTMSGAGRAELCPPSTFLQRIEETSRYAACGSAIHKYLADVATIGAEKALAAVPEDFRSGCEVIDLAALPHSDPGAWAVEVGLAWDWEADTGRELFRGDGRRDYSGAGPTELCGTADILGVAADAVVVLDLKTGWSRLAPPAEAPQILGYAVAAARAYGKERAIVGWIRLRDETPYYEHATLDLLELDAAAARLRAIIEAAQGAELLYQADPTALSLSVGEHCRYCPAYRCCPANVGLLADLVYRDRAGEVPVLDEETAPLVLVRAEAAQKVLDRVLETLKAYAEVTPILLPDGEVFGAVEQTRESIDALAAKYLLSDELWNEAAKVETKLTKADLERALKKRLAPGEKITAVKRECFRALAEAGALRTSSFTSVKRHRPKKLEALPSGAVPAPAEEPKSTPPADVVAFPKPEKGSPELVFGPNRGKRIAELTELELSASIAIAQDKLSREPVAPWVGAISGQLDHLLAEQQRRTPEAS